MAYVATHIIGANSPATGNDKTTFTGIFDTTMTALDTHNHTSTKGVQIPTGGIVDGAITAPKLGTASVTVDKLDPTWQISARYTTTAGQSVATSGLPIVNFGTKAFDSADPDAVTTGTGWVFTAPGAGKHLISAFVTFENSAWSANPVVSLQLKVNNALVAMMAYEQVKAAFTGRLALHGVPVLVDLAQGDILSVYVDQNSGGPKLLETATGFNWISIVRTGT